MCYISGDSALTGFGVDHELTLGSIALRLGAIAILIIANAFFVAAEFALVGARRSRIDQQAETGDRGARRVQQILKQLDLYNSAAQLGITLASLALGFIGEATLAVLIDMALGAAGFNAPSVATHTTAAII